MHSFEELGLDKYKIGQAVQYASLGFSAYYDEQTKELVITAVANGSEADEKGIKIGDRVVTAAGKTIFGAEDMKIKVKQAAGGVLSLLLKDADGTYGVSLQVEDN